MCHVQQECARCICDIDRPFSREAKAHIIFWKHDRADAIPLFWLIFPNPQELGDSEIRQGWIRGKLNQSLGTDPFRQRAALFFCAHITPDQRWTHNSVLLIEHDGTVHLTRKANASDVITRQIGIGECLSDCNGACSPPVRRILLGPSNLRRRKRNMLLRCRAEYLPLLAQDERSGPAGANIDAE